MTTTKSVTHTPGPWHASGREIFGSDGDVFVAIAAGVDDPCPPIVTEVQPNIHLIAAAPDLLAACLALRKYTTRRNGTPASYLEVMETFVEDGSTLTECLDLARAALLKAEGAQS